MAKKILLVDDSDVVRRSVGDVLRLNGFEVTEAADGGAALDLLAAQGTYDAIITDIMVPEVDGVTLIREARKDERYTSTPIIVLASKPEPSKVDESEKAGATGWLVKPFGDAQLLAELGRVLQ
ncbi:response regulator [Streptomyces sp. NPDC007905]|uniref:response regulator n=1 Tax=Streptomyces sp. NPDC007905 TaxID=3364788 RepID=UPI0036EE5A17